MQAIRKIGVGGLIFISIIILLIVNATIKLHEKERRYSGIIRCYNSNYYARIIFKNELIVLRDVGVKFNGPSTDVSYYYKDVVLDADNFNKIMRCMDYTDICTHNESNDPDAVKSIDCINTYRRYIHKVITETILTYRLRNDGHIKVRLSGNAL